MGNLNEGFIILVVGMLIVFSSLLLLFLVFGYLMPSILSIKKRRISFNKNNEEEIVVEELASGEEMAAVASAIYLFMDQIHDEENAIVTINKVAKNYSPWSSKIYTTHQLYN